MGEGSVPDTTPQQHKRRHIPGYLIFSNETVDFRLKKTKDDDFGFETEFSILDEMEGEACHENNILFITVSHYNMRYCLDVSEDGEGGRAVYHPQWINFGKRYNEQQKQ